MKLDEIEAQIRTLCGAAPTQDGYVRGDVEAACSIALALVAHVRALQERVEVLSRNAGEDFDRITALGEKVAALEHGSDGPGREQWGPGALDRLRDAVKERDVLRAENATLKESVVELGLRVGGAGGGAASAVEEMVRLRAENARLESRHQDQLAEGRAANARLTEERDRLRAENAELAAKAKDALHRRDWADKNWMEVVAERDAALKENAELREKLAKTAEALENTRKMSWTECERLRVENAELRKGVECPLPHCECATWARDVKAGEVLKGHHPRCVLPYAPAPDPQENAALKQAKDDAQAVAREYIEEVTRLREEKEALQKTLDRYSQARARAEERLEAQQKFLLESCRGYDVDRLGKVIETLKSLPPDLVLPVGLSNPHSYRGYYEQLAFEPKENVSVEECLKVAKSCVDKMFTGYKGGDYMMTEDTSCWLCTYGSSGGVQLSAFLIRLLAGMNLAYRS